MDRPVRAFSLHLHLFISVNQRPSAFQSRAAKLWWAGARRDGFCPPFHSRIDSTSPPTLQCRNFSAG